MYEFPADLPSLSALIATSPLKTGPGVGLNEVIVFTGYHPWDFGRVATRAFGGKYPDPSDDDWEMMIAPFRMMREARGGK